MIQPPKPPANPLRHDFRRPLSRMNPSLTPSIGFPSVGFDNAVSAMTDAVTRLRALVVWDHWIVFVAQGVGHKPGEYHFAEIRMLGHRLDLGRRRVDTAGIIRAARTEAASLVVEGDYYSVAAASPPEVARLFDSIFRLHFGIRPFPGDGNDYPVGAEWREDSHSIAA